MSFSSLPSSLVDHPALFVVGAGVVVLVALIGLMRV